MTVFGRVFQQQYGLSEGAGTSLHRDEHEPDGDEKAQRRLRSIGVQFAGAEVRIGDDEGQSLSVGTAGEILLRTPGNMVGYWNNSAATIEALRDGRSEEHTAELQSLMRISYAVFCLTKKEIT